MLSCSSATFETSARTKGRMRLMELPLCEPAHLAHQPRRDAQGPGSVVGRENTLVRLPRARRGSCKERDGTLNWRDEGAVQLHRDTLVEDIHRKHQQSPARSAAHQD